MAVVAQESAKKLEATMKSLQNTMQQTAFRADNAARGLELVGGVSKVTDRDLAHINRTLQDGLAAYQALGQKAPQELQKVADAVSLKLKKPTEDVTSGIGNIIGSVGRMAAVLGVGFSVGAVINFGRRVLDSADALVKLSDKTGVTINGLNRLQAAGDDAGNSIDEITQAITMMQDRVAGGDKSALRAIEKLGLNFEVFKTLDAEGRFIAISDALRQMQNPADQINVSMDLFGRTGAAVLPTLKRGFDDLKGSIIGMTDETARTIDDWGDKVGKTARRTAGFLANLAVGIAKLPGQIGFGPAAERAAREAKELEDSLKGATAAAAANRPTMAKLREVIVPLPDLINSTGFEVAEMAEKLATDKAEAKKAAEEIERFRNSVTNLTSSAVGAQRGLGAFGRLLPELTGNTGDWRAQIELLSSRDLPDLKSRLQDIGKDAGESFERAELAARTFGDTMRSLGRGDFGQVFGDLQGFLKGGLGKVGTGILEGFGNIISGGITSLISKGLGALVSGIGKLFGSTAEKQINPLRQAFVDAAGGLDILNRKAVAAGTTLREMLDAKNPQQYEAAIRNLNAALDFQSDAMATLDETTKRYGFTLAELGPAFQRQELDKQAQALFKDFQVLTGAGINIDTVISKMSGTITEFVKNARLTGTEVPAAMKPMLDRMLEMGLLTDEGGNAFGSLEDAGIQFSLTMSEGFRGLIDEVKKLTDAIGRGLGVALQNIPRPDPVIIDIKYRDPGRDVFLPDFAATGGLVTSRGIQHFAGGGRVLPFLKRGPDTVPIMATPGEYVLTPGQLAGVAGGGNNNAAMFSFMEQRLAKIIARTTRDEVQKVMRR